MTIDYAHPLAPDLYDSATNPDVLEYIRDNMAANSKWLEGLDPAGKQAGFKRLNAGNIEEWNGTAWIAKPLAYVPKTGAADITGSLGISAVSPAGFSVRVTDAPANKQITGVIGNAAGESYFGRRQDDLSAWTAGLKIGADGKLYDIASGKPLVTNDPAGQYLPLTGGTITGPLTIQQANTPLLLLNNTGAPAGHRISRMSVENTGMLFVGKLNDAVNTWLGGIYVNTDNKVYDMATNKPFVTTAGATFTGLITAPQLSISTNASWWEDGNNVYFQHAPNWYWVYSKATGQLTWLRNGANGFNLMPSGEVYSGGPGIYTGAGQEIGIYAAANGDRALRFTTDFWRLQWNNGTLAYFNNGGAVLFSVDSGGQVVANNNFAANGGLGTGLVCANYSTGGSTFTRSVFSCNPSWNWEYLQGTHASGNWAGFTMTGNGTSILFSLSTGLAYGTISAQDFYKVSDERGKEQIALLAKQSDAFMAIQPIEWHWPPPREGAVNPDTRPSWGFSAQNLAQCVPLAVHGDVNAIDEDGNPVTAGVTDTPILALTVLEVQDLLRRVSALEAA